MNSQAKASKKTVLGIYVHIPFCGSACDFCTFYQEKPNRRDLKRYLGGVTQEIEERVPDDALVETIFYGGGTPGLLPLGDLEALGKAMLKKIGRRPIEWTVEMAPATVKRDKLQVLKDLGVTRISMGVQSFDKSLLKSLGRLHGPDQVYKAYDWICEVDFRDVNLDLIFAIPGQSLRDWEKDLERAIALDPEHISTYCLTFEEDTALYVKLSEGKVQRDIEAEVRMYERTWDFLKGKGYEQYEISNFAKSGYACLHNLNTWDMQSWIGLGPSAASQYGGRRWKHSSSLDKWLEGLEEGILGTEEEETLNDAVLAVDSVVFGLRMNKGIDIDVLQMRFPQGNWEEIHQRMVHLENERYCVRQGAQWQLTPRGRLVADRIGAEILEWA